MPIFLGCKLDRVVLQKDLEYGQIYSLYESLFKLCMATGTGIPKNFKIKEVKKTTAAFLMKDGRPAVVIEIISTPTMKMIRYKLFMSRLAHSQFEKFVVQTDVLGSGSYPAVLCGGYLREFEIALDVIGLHTSRFVFHRRNVKVGKHVKSPGQTAGTYYLGSLTSPMQICAYNKSEQLAAAGLPTQFPTLMRIEARFRKQKISAHELTAIDNPFSEVWICPINVLLDTSFPEHYVWKTFLARCAALGVPEALRQAPKKYRAKFRTLLREKREEAWTQVAWPGFAGRAIQQLHVALCNQ